MRQRAGRGGITALVLATSLATVPTVAGAQPIDPIAVADSPPHVKALVSAVLVALVGVGLLGRHGGFVDRAVDDTMDRPAIAVVYGLFAYILVLFFGFYANDLMARAGVADTPVGYLALAIIVGGVLVLSSLGYLVVGTLLTDLYRGRGARSGLVAGALLSGVSWLVLPVLAGAAVWILVAAVGVGGPTRTWVHSERTAPPEVQT